MSKAVCYIVYDGELNSNTKVVGYDKAVHIFSNRGVAKEAIKQYKKSWPHNGYSIVEGLIDFETLTNMASCAWTGNSYILM